jgi:hypothetical protein
VNFRKTGKNEVLFCLFRMKALSLQSEKGTIKYYRYNEEGNTSKKLPSRRF